MQRKLLSSLMYVLTVPLLCLGQFSGNNLAEYQYGRLPSDDSSFSTIYNRLVTNYQYKGVKARGTIETFQSPINNRNYINLSQFSLRLKQQAFNIRVGNFYETIGRGTLLRSFEIPGAILEDLSYRSRHYFNRDILGAIARVKLKNIETKLIYGKPLNYVFPPTQDSSRRVDEIAAVYAEYNRNQQTFGAALMNHWNSRDSALYAMLTASGIISPSLSYYSEVSKNIGDYDIVNFSSDSSFAIYTGINFSHDNLGLSLEYKNYKNFLIGSGINEPPALVREHEYSLLNRSTHVLQPTNESGYQVEVFYSFDDFSTLTANYTRAINDFSKKHVFQEYFLEYALLLRETHGLKLFGDYALDPFKSQDNRTSFGLNSDWNISKSSALKVNYEFQSFSRFGRANQNQVFVLGYGRLSKLILNIVVEKSNDSFIVTKGSKFWTGFNARYQLNKKHSLQLFAGERRGGPACNAGVCYEVLDFKGVELRLTSRL